MSDQTSTMTVDPTLMQRAQALGQTALPTYLLIIVLSVLPLFLGGSWTFTLGLCFANSIGVLAVSLLVRYGGEVSIGHTFFTALGAYSVGVLDTRFGVSL